MACRLNVVRIASIIAMVLFIFLANRKAVATKRSEVATSDWFTFLFESLFEEAYNSPSPYYEFQFFLPFQFLF